jgi:N-acetyl-gamma-glutamyl-phosphate reductase
MGARVAVAGASGYAGGELLRLLAGHPDFEIAAVTAGASAGQLAGEVHPALAGAPELAGLELQTLETAALADCDLVFLALPAGESAAAASNVPDHVKVVDLGPDFRLADAGAWQRHYATPHAGRWVTGLPELPGGRAAISNSSRVAAPGCYATAAMLALVPFVAAGLADPADVVIVAASGTSGAGRSPRTDLLASEIMGSVSAYAVASHRHAPEIEQALTEQLPEGADRAGLPDVPAVRVSFTPMLAPMPRGILATCTARLTDPGLTTPELHEALAAAYAGEPFVTVLPARHWPATASVAGSNGAHLQVAADEAAGRVVVVAAIDNLGKGAAGQAIQDANLMLGLPEKTGLTAIGVTP